MALKPIWNYINNKYKLKTPSRVWTWEWIFLWLLSIHHLIQFGKQFFSGIQAERQPSAGYFICLIWQSIWIMQKSRFRILHGSNGKSILLSSLSTLPYSFCHQANKSAFIVFFIFKPVFFVTRLIFPYI